MGGPNLQHDTRCSEPHEKPGWNDPSHDVTLSTHPPALRRQHAPEAAVVVVVVIAVAVAVAVIAAEVEVVVVVDVVVVVVVVDDDDDEVSLHGDGSHDTAL